MRTRLAQLRHQWRRIALRTRMGLLIAVVAIAGLAWQHNSDSETAAPRPDQQAAQDGEINHDGHDHDHDGHALGEYQPDPRELAAPPDFSPEAARVTAERFATNFASPNGNRDDWLARICPDVSMQLAEQYRLTDIRNVTQADVTSVDGPVRQEPGAMTFDIGYSDGSRIDIRLAAGADGWKVINVLPLTGDGVRPAPDDETEQPTQSARGEESP